MNTTLTETKETVIVVHGTFASPVPDEEYKWYEMSRNGAPSNFVNRLDELLANKGSSARCWLHCQIRFQIFYWSGANNWLDRAQAAGELARYIDGLHAAGWTCHIIAHSHGGNVACDALRLLKIKPAQGRAALVTLGTPFIDALSTFGHEDREFGLRVDAYSPFILAAILGVGLLFLLSSADTAFIVWYLIAFGVFYFIAKSEGQERRAHTSATLGAPAQSYSVFCMNSIYDEPWQLLHHVREQPNPLIPQKSFLAHAAAAYRSRKRRLQQVDSIVGNTRPTSWVAEVA